MWLLRPKSDTNASLWRGKLALQSALKKSRRVSYAEAHSEEFYKKQCDLLSSYLLVHDDKPFIETEQEKIKPILAGVFQWINKGELIAGSYVTAKIYQDNGDPGDSPIHADDIDIFFKTKEDAIEFSNLNKLGVEHIIDDKAMCVYSEINGISVNIIYGVPFDSPESLVSSFDIRACSVAIDPNSDTLIAVKGAIDDILEKMLVFNPVPRATSIARVIKYTLKGFELSPCQRLFFAQLVRSDIWNSELELKTGKYSPDT